MYHKYNIYKDHRYGENTTLTSGFYFLFDLRQLGTRASSHRARYYHTQLIKKKKKHCPVT